MTFTAQFFVDNISPDVVAAKPVCHPCWRLALQIVHPSWH
jgi:hypothetical protein